MMGRQCLGSIFLGKKKRLFQGNLDLPRLSHSTLSLLGTFVFHGNFTWKFPVDPSGSLPATNEKFWGLMAALQPNGINLEYFLAGAMPSVQHFWAWQDQQIWVTIVQPSDVKLFYFESVLGNVLNPKSLYHSLAPLTFLSFKSISGWIKPEVFEVLCSGLVRLNCAIIKAGKKHGIVNIGEKNSSVTKSSCKPQFHPSGWLGGVTRCLCTWLYKNAAFQPILERL